MLHQPRARKKRDSQTIIGCLPKITSSPEIDAIHKEVAEIISWLSNMKPLDYNSPTHKQKLKRLEYCHKRNAILKSIPGKC